MEEDGLSMWRTYPSTRLKTLCNLGFEGSCNRQITQMFKQVLVPLWLKKPCIRLCMQTDQECPPWTRRTREQIGGLQTTQEQYAHPVLPHVPNRQALQVPHHQLAIEAPCRDKRQPAKTNAKVHRHKRYAKSSAAECCEKVSCEGLG